MWSLHMPTARTARLVASASLLHAPRRMPERQSSTYDSEGPPCLKPFWYYIACNASLVLHTARQLFPPHQILYLLRMDFVDHAHHTTFTLLQKVVRIGVWQEQHSFTFSSLTSPRPFGTACRSAPWAPPVNHYWPARHLARPPLGDCQKKGLS